MRVETLTPDAPLAPPRTSEEDPGASSFARAVDALAGVLAGAESAEDAFAYGGGSLQDAVYERARADVALSVATATAQRIAQSVQSVLNMQV